MSSFIDHLSASLVAGIVILMLVGMHHRGQATAVESVLFYANRAQALSLVEMIERDFPNIGSGVAAGDPMLLSHAWSGSTGHFEFWAAVDSAAGAPAQHIRYEAVPSESAVCEQAGLACFEVRRLVRAGSGFEVSGRSQETLTAFEIELLPVGAPLERVREVRVKMAALSPSGGAGTVPQTSWETRFRPFSLALPSL